MEVAAQMSLRPDVVEKDYVLGWLLAGIGRHPELGPAWVFKGGTCLKKCFFETYRFSEDLDFTVITPTLLTVEVLQRSFDQISAWIYEQTGIEFPPVGRIFEVYQSRDRAAAQGRLPYRGPLARRGDLPKVKLDLTADECLVLPAEHRLVYRTYSDCTDAVTISSYCYEEVFAEKIRALSERLRPRDLYDVIHMYRQAELRPNPRTIREILQEKCDYKNIPFPALASLDQEPRRAELQSEWENMLAHQLPLLPPFEQFWNELPELFAWMSEELVPVVLPSIAREEVDGSTQFAAPPYQAEPTAPPAERPPIKREEVRGPVGLPPQEIGPIVPPMQQTASPGFRPEVRPMGRIEAIRFAGANRLCIVLGYNGTKRLVEPYSLRRTKDDNVVLHTVRVDSGQPRAYRIDKIESVELTQRPFKPRYAIELTATGPLYIPQQSSSRAGTGMRTSHVRRGHSGPRYVFRCPVCDKKFTRQKYDSRLNEHKNKDGYPCQGRYGIFEETKWD